MSDDDVYRIVSAIYHGCSPNRKVFFIDTKQGRKPVPFSLIHAADASKIEKAEEGTEITFRLRAWKAEILALAGVEDERE